MVYDKLCGCKGPSFFSLDTCAVRRKVGWEYYIIIAQQCSVKLLVLVPTKQKKSFACLQSPRNLWDCRQGDLVVQKIDSSFYRLWSPFSLLLLLLISFLLLYQSGSGSIVGHEIILLPPIYVEVLVAIAYVCSHCNEAHYIKRLFCLLPDPCRSARPTQWYGVFESSLDRIHSRSFLFCLDSFAGMTTMAWGMHETATQKRHERRHLGEGGAQPAAIDRHADGNRAQARGCAIRESRVAKTGSLAARWHVRRLRLCGKRTILLPLLSIYYSLLPPLFFSLYREVLSPHFTNFMGTFWMFCQQQCIYLFSSLDTSIPL